MRLSTTEDTAALCAAALSLSLNSLPIASFNSFWNFLPCSLNFLSKPSLKEGNLVERAETESQVQYDAGDKGLFRHYMQKEIYEQPMAIKSTLEGRLHHGQVDLSELGAAADTLLSQVQHIQIIACGTSYNSGLFFPFSDQFCWAGCTRSRCFQS